MMNTKEIHTNEPIPHARDQTMWSATMMRGLRMPKQLIVTYAFWRAQSPPPTLGMISNFQWLSCAVVSQYLHDDGESLP